MSKPRRTVKTKVETAPHTPYTDILLIYDVVRRNLISRWLTAIVIIMFMIWFPIARDNLNRFDQVCHLNVKPYLIEEYGCHDINKCEVNHTILTTTSETQMITLFDLCNGRSKHYHSRVVDWYRARTKKKTDALTLANKIEACEEELIESATAELTEDAYKKIASVCSDRFNDTTPAT